MMNDRIEKFVDEAEEYAVRVTTGDWEVGLAYQDLFNKKFAELIVKECANLFEIEYGTSEVSGNEVARVLKEHFGVE